MDIGSADRLALQNLQISEHSTNRTLPKFSFPRRFPDKQRLTSGRPGQARGGRQQGGGPQIESLWLGWR
eukprot:930983-Pelagomonas_calceolata.AAC.1